MAATIPADIAQYYGYMLRVTQKLLYLYGFPEIDVTEKGKKFDTETLNILTLCLGVMYGVAGANNELKAPLQDTFLCNPDHEITAEENAFDIEAAEIKEYSEESEE